MLATQRVNEVHMNSREFSPGGPNYAILCFLCPKHALLPPPPYFSVMFEPRSTVPFATFWELYLKKVQSTEIDVMSMLFELYDWTKGLT